MRYVSLLTAIMFSLSVNAQVAIKEGDPAPSDGVFLTNKQAAKILAEKKAQDDLCEANTNFEKEKVTSVCKLEKQNLEISVETQKQKYEEIVSLKDKEIERLYEQVEENAADYGAYWFAGGLAFGAVVAAVSSIAIFFAASQANKAPSLVSGE